MNDFRSDSYFDPPDSVDYTAAEIAKISKRTDELIEQRIDNDGERFADLMTGIEHVSDVYSHLSRMIANIDRACLGDPISITAVLTAVSNLQSRVMQEAECWRDELQRQAEKEL